ncbi:hypothetical protein [Actinoplanes xinjiangensis]|uniref:Uncharacterized protein n=1 Tax=Actinoplanes xinjiangensis TaxID=512350 RepID=A0A316E9G0_9ACTN|nr:hypothetical protein [Actinoplanes xinjiangensis]PWK26288.1 hypothetical protein BC793_1656 [Actinoplanes xinjiangensis]GIF45414.1 hypothetical protein Axi01nite_97250 [Actinoplanes xinjiangensis]
MAPSRQIGVRYPGASSPVASYPGGCLVTPPFVGVFGLLGALYQDGEVDLLVAGEYVQPLPYVLGRCDQRFENLG